MLLSYGFQPAPQSKSQSSQGEQTSGEESKASGMMESPSFLKEIALKSSPDGDAYFKLEDSPYFTWLGNCSGNHGNLRLASRHFCCVDIITNSGWSKISFINDGLRAGLGHGTG